MKKFALIGVAGYIAPRHLQAILDTGHELVAALDTHDSVGVLDRYFPQAEFYTTEEGLRGYLQGLREKGQAVDYLVVCSPNYLHEKHIRLGFDCGCDVICEKPVAIKPGELSRLKEAERQSGKKVYTIMQLRLHPALAALKQRISQEAPDRHYRVELKYITPRGKWYHRSWKGDRERSGGLLMNIGIHLFDLLQWLFGPPVHTEPWVQQPCRANGTLQLSRAVVRWQLSIDRADLPGTIAPKGDHAYRLLEVDGNQVDFSVLGNDLHRRSYEEILAGRGFGLEVAGESLGLLEWMEAQPQTGSAEIG